MNTADNIWAGDLLGRQDEGEFLIRFMRERLEERRQQSGVAGSMVLNVAAEWGHGKTFFLDRIAKQLRADGHIVARVDAWQSDFASDPMLPVMAALEVAVEDLLATQTNQGEWIKKVREGLGRVKDNAGEITLAGIAGAGRGLVNRFLPGFSADVGKILEGKDKVDDADLGEAIEAAIEGAGSTIADRVITSLMSAASKRAVDEYKEAAASIGHFRDQLADLLQQAQAGGIPMPMFVLVDELDRCRPPYAIEMLERIKHLFTVDNVIFVVATPTRQLTASIKAVYGNDFDAHAYLHRFFDRTYTMAEPDFGAYVEQRLKSVPRTNGDIPRMSAAEYAATLFRACGLSFRDAIQVTDQFETIRTTWGDRPPLSTMLMLPIICANHLGVRGTTPHEIWVGLREIMNDKDGPIIELGGASPPRLFSLIDQIFSHIRGSYSSILNNGLETPSMRLAQRLEGTRRGDGFHVAYYPQIVRMAGRLIE